MIILSALPAALNIGIVSLQVLGKKDILSTLQAGCPSPVSGSDIGKFESVRGQARPGAGDSKGPHVGSNPQQQPFRTGPAYTGPSLLLVSGALLCLVGLLMPTEGDHEPTVMPIYLHLTSNIKIVLAYVLGKSVPIILLSVIHTFFLVFQMLPKLR